MVVFQGQGVDAVDASAGGTKHESSLGPSCDSSAASVTSPPRSVKAEDKTDASAVEGAGASACSVGLHELCRVLGEAAFGDRGLVKTMAHALIVCAAVAAVVSFSKALVAESPYDATLAGLSVLLCWHVFRLLNERFKLERSTSGSCEPGWPSSSSRAAGLADALDLPGCARQLGLPTESTFLAQNDAVLNQLLLTSLAKEHMRCLGALKQYQVRFGPLSQDGTIAPRSTVPTSLPFGASSSQFGTHAKPRALNLAELNTASAGGVGGGFVNAGITPRSPRGPPSPEQQRRSSRAFRRDASVTRLAGSDP